jgi:hypothetical protein
MSGPGKILLGLMSEHDNRVHASGHSDQADQVRREDLSLWAAVLQVVVQAGAPASLSLSTRPLP